MKDDDSFNLPLKILNAGLFYITAFLHAKKGYRNSAPGVLLLQITPFFQPFFVSMGCQNNTRGGAKEFRSPLACLKCPYILTDSHIAPLRVLFWHPFFLSVNIYRSKKIETFHAEILKMSNHILRNCKNATFLYSGLWKFSTVLTKKKFPGGNFLNLHTAIFINLPCKRPFT